MSEPPATPRLAATILLLRRGGRHVERGVEVLMVRRVEGARFMPGVWVFPGGALEPGESPQRCAARELREEAGIDLGPEPELRSWSRWVTPELSPVRFDTLFVVGLCPPHSPPKADGVEVTEAAWFAPAAALGAHRAGDLELVFPTIKTLEQLLEFETADQALEAARTRPVARMLPRALADGSGRIVLPGESAPSGE